MLKNKRVLRYWCQLWLIIIVTSQIVAQNFNSANSSQLTVYFEGPDNIDYDVTLEFEKVLIVSNSDTFTVVPLVKYLNSIDLSNKQILFAEQYLIPGNYNYLIFYIKSIRSMAGSAKIQPEVDTNGVIVPISLHLFEDQSSVLFIHWNPTKNDYIDKKYIPHFNPKKHHVPPSGSLAFVSNENSGNISVIDCFKNKVVENIRVGDKPLDLVYSPVNQQIYVANSESNTISVINIDLRKVSRTIDLVFEDAPERLILSVDEDKLYILNKGSNSILVYDLYSYEEIIKLNIGNYPIDFKLDRFTDDLFFSSLYSDNLSIFNLLNQIEPILVPLNMLPAELEISYNPKRIYMAQQTQPSVSILDIESRKMNSSIDVCSQITSMVYDPYSMLLYAAIKECKEISIIDPNSEIEIETIVLIDEPGKISFDNQFKNLMVTFPDQNKISFINTNREIEAEINVGKKPYKIIQP